MKEIKTTALIGLGAIGGFAAPKLHSFMGEERFTVIAGGQRKKDWNRKDAVLMRNFGNFILQHLRMPSQWIL